MRKHRNIAAALLLGTLTFAVCECANARGGDGLGEYLTEMKMFFRDKELANDLRVGDSLSTREYNSKYEMIHIDRARAFFSYRSTRYSYTGGAHGSQIVEIGTMDVAAWRKLTLDDVIPADKRAEALARLKAAVIKKIGKENLQGEVKLTDNFCVMEDGLHFVFQEYEVAAYAVGSVEVVIPAYGKYKSHGAK